MASTKRESRILVVDDEPDLNLCYRLALEYAGFKVDAYIDSSEALSNFRPGFYDLIILDIKMPIMDGFTLYDALKEKDSKAKICFLTASEMFYERYRKSKYSSLEKDLFLRKPISNVAFSRRNNGFYGDVKTDSKEIGTIYFEIQYI